MFGLPLEIITMLGSALMSSFMTIWGKKAETQNKMMDLAMQQFQVTKADTSEARANTKMEFTRRIIALSMVGAVFVLPAIAAIFGLFPITYGWTEFDPGGFFTVGRDVLKWITIQGGFVITPLHTHAVMSIIGMYFGVRMGGR